MNYSYTGTEGTATYTKTYYDWSTYKYYDGSSSTMTKYNYSRGDAPMTLELDDDAARANWGDNWRMPTSSELLNLYNKCTREWTENYHGTGVAGYVFTSTNGNSLFFPAAGCRYQAVLEDAGNVGYYWASTIQWSLQATSMFFTSDQLQTTANTDCHLGGSVRAVIEP